MMSIFNRATRQPKPGSKPPSQRRRIKLGSLHVKHPIYAIGDIHGCYKELLAAEARILADVAKEGRPGVIILLGDYVDRGPKSAAVLDHLIGARTRGIRRLPVCGNHDAAFLSFLQSPSKSVEWLDFGGRETLMSYGINPDHILRRGGGMQKLNEIIAETVPDSHLDFLGNLPVSVSIGPYLFVHAGIRPGLSIDQQSDEDLMWIREPFLSQGPGLPVTVIHGHTISEKPVFKPDRIGIDTGAFMTGNLTVLKIDDGHAALI